MQDSPHFKPHQRALPLMDHQVGTIHLEARTLADCAPFMTDERPEFVVGHILDLCAQLTAAPEPKAVMA